MERLLPSLRYTLRLLLKSPGFTITAVLILGFGIGANTAIFSLIDTVLLKPLPFPNPEQIVQIFVDRPSSPLTPISYPTFLDLCKDQRTFQELAVTLNDELDLTDNGVPERFNVSYATAGLFRVTRGSFLLGQPFAQSDDKSDGAQVVVLSEHIWRNRFQSDPGIVGKNISLSGHSFQVVGVCAPQAHDLDVRPVDVYLPLHAADLFGYHIDKRDELIGACVGRLKAGFTKNGAVADLTRIHDNLSLRYPDTERGWVVRVISVLDYALRNYSVTVWVVGVAAGCLLLVSTANIANLLLLRAAERRRETAIRFALGASVRDLITQCLSEAIILSFAGALIGIPVAILAVDIVKIVSPQKLYRLQEINIDIAGLLFVTGLTVIIAVLSACLPAWSTSKTDPDRILKANGGRAASRGPRDQNIQSLLIIAQCTLATLLLVGTGLLVRSFQETQDMPLGFNPEHLVTALVYPTNAKYTDVALAHRFFDQVFENVRRIPGVTNAAMNDNLPFVWDSGYFCLPFHIHGQPAPDPGQEPMLVSQGISAGYFKTMQIAFVRGRDFDERDQPGQQDVMIIDQAFAERFFPGTDPIGKQIDFKSFANPMKAWTIVGVVANSLNNHPDNDRAIPVQAYFPYTQRATGLQYLILRTTDNLSDLIPQIRKAVATVDPDVVVTDHTLFDDLIANKYAGRRLGIFLFSVFSCSALILAAVGIYGVLAYFVDQSSREIGIRCAVGARLSHILGLVIGRGLRLVLSGLLLGLVCALVVGHFLENVLYNVAPSDPTSILLAAVVLILTGSLSCLLPALRAIRINPIAVLHE
jgi:putative ABC transport system permease protein